MNFQVGYKMAQVLEQRVAQELRKHKVAKLFNLAEKYGVIKKGWSCIDYMRDSVKNYGWESTCISGPKGTAKSNLMLQHGLAIYGDMEKVKRFTVTKRKQLLDHMENAINNERRIAWIGVDDIAALFPKSLYFTHRKLYSKLQASWETVRTVMNNFEFSCTLKNKVASFILQDITGDIKCYNRKGEIKSHYDYQRWLWLRSIKDPTQDIAKLIRVEDIPFPLIPEAFKLDASLGTAKYFCGGREYIGEDFFKNKACLVGISRDDFKDYWNNRLGLARESFREFKEIFEEPETKQVKLECEVQNAEPSSNVSEYARALARKSHIKRRSMKEEIKQLRAKVQELQSADAQSAT